MTRQMVVALVLGELDSDRGGEVVDRCGFKSMSEDCVFAVQVEWGRNLAAVKGR